MKSNFLTQLTHSVNHTDFENFNFWHLAGFYNLLNAILDLVYWIFINRCTKIRRADV